MSSRPRAHTDFRQRASRRNRRILTSLPTPSIVHWNFNHYVVFEGIKGDRVFLNDPASGPRTVSMAEFEQSYTGVVLAFEPTPEFEPRGRAPSIVKALRARVSRIPKRPWFSSWAPAC